MVDTENVANWSVDDVANWLHQINFGKYADIFYKYRINGLSLCDLSQDRFDSITRAHMGRDDRASVLWRNINSIKSRRIKPGAQRERRRVPQQPIPASPPDPCPRDYIKADDCDEVYEIPPDNDEDIHYDSFTDDSGSSDDGEEQEDYLEPEGSGPPKVPNRPNLNKSWGHQNNTAAPPAGLTELPRQPVDCGDTYLDPTEDHNGFYDTPDSEHNDGIYDVPDDGEINIQTEARLPPSQHKLGGGQMPRIPTGRVPPKPAPFCPAVRNEPAAPPIPSRPRQPQQIPPEEEEEYTCPDDGQQEYMTPEEDHHDFGGDYLEPNLKPEGPSFKNIQDRELPSVPGSGGMQTPPRPNKISVRDLPAPPPATAPDVPPAIPSRPPRIPPGGPSSSIHNPTTIPEIRNKSPDRLRPPISTPVCNKPPIAIINHNVTNNNENDNHATGGVTSSLISQMRSRFEQQDTSVNSMTVPPGRKPLTSPKQFGMQRDPPPPPVVVQRSGNISTTRRTGLTGSTSSNDSMSSVRSTGSPSGSDSGTFIPPSSSPSHRRPSHELPMPPVPSPTPMPPLPPPNQPSLHKGMERLRPTPVEQPRPSPALPPPSPRRQPVAPTSMCDLEGYPWYHGDLQRKEAVEALNNCQRNGAFIVRKGGRGNPETPYSVTLWYNGATRNLQIRKRGEDQKYALGNKKPNEKAFDTPAQLIQYHMTNPLILAKDQGETTLSIPAPVYR